MTKKRIIFVLSFIVLISSLPYGALAARTVPGNVPILDPLQPPPENTKPNVSNNIHSGNPTPPGQEESIEERTTSPQALEEIKDTLPLPLPESNNSSWAWLITALIIILIGFGIGYLVHIRNKN